MDPSIFILSLNPAMAAIFATALFLLWWFQPQHRYIAVLAASYVAKTLAFALQILFVPGIEAWARLVSNALFIVTALAFAGGLLARFHRPAPVVTLGVIAVATLGALSWYLFVDPQVGARILVMNGGLALICFVIARELADVANKNFVERLLMGVLAAHGVVFLLRPFAVLAHGQEALSGAATVTSPYWFVVTGSDILLSIVLILTLLATLALDVVGRLKSESGHDPLSGVLNRRGFEEQANAVLALAGDRPAPMTVVLCDLDHFKRINDTYGHGPGDEVIVAFADHLVQAASAEAIIGRLGGEEFAVLLPTGDIGTARLFAEGVRASFSATPVDGLPEAVRVSASFGIALAEPGDTLKDLVHRADLALYQAKKDGRDRVRVAAPEAVGPRSGRDGRAERRRLSHRRARVA